MTVKAENAASLTDDQLAEKVIAIISEQALSEVDDVTLATTPDDLGIDSLGLVEIVFAIEETFDITVPYNANDPTASDFDFSTVGAVVDAVKRLIEDQKPS